MKLFGIHETIRTYWNDGNGRTKNMKTIWNSFDVHRCSFAVPIFSAFTNSLHVTYFQSHYSIEPWSRKICFFFSSKITEAQWYLLFFFLSFLFRLHFISNTSCRIWTFFSRNFSFFFCFWCFFFWHRSRLFGNSALSHFALQPSNRNCGYVRDPCIFVCLLLLLAHFSLAFVFDETRTLFVR